MKNLKIEVGKLSEKDKDERKGYAVKIKPKFKNMKIEINADQPLGEVCGELERLGYRPHSKFYGCEVCVLTQVDGLYCGDSSGRFNNGYDLKALTEIKAMGREDD